MMKNTGLILKGVGGFYTVASSDGEIHVLKARGKFRNEHIRPLPGDIVVFSKDTIDDITERKNEFIRPAVANVTKLMLVISANIPKADLLLADKLLLQCERSSVLPIIILNKWDEYDEEYANAIAEQYKYTNYPLIRASAYDGTGIDEIIRHIKGNTCCFAGQSAVGKSSLLNRIGEGLTLKTGDMSQKTDRGRHTTRHAELFLMHGGVVVDTPGFSLLDMSDMEPESLAMLYPEMRESVLKCRFAKCLHISEPDCSVKSLLNNGGLPHERYERYKIFLNEIKELRRRKYD